MGSKDTNILLPFSIDLINQNNFKDYFEKPLNECNIGDKYLKQVCENIHYLNRNKRTDYYKYIEKRYINELLKRPVVCTVLLSCLLNKDFVRKNFLDIFNRGNDKNINNTTNKNLISSNNSKFFPQYLNFLLGQFEAVNAIFAGIYELVKNIVEHSEKHEGTILINTTTKDQLNNNGENKTNEYLWENYFAFINDKFDKKNPAYLDISITDVGTIGIIETSLQNMEKKGDWRDIDEEIRKPDAEKIKEGIKDCNGDKAKEAELLFNMYFNQEKDNPLKLDRQANNSYKGLGIYLFTEFVNQNNGLFNLQTNKYGSRNETIDFSYYNQSFREKIINPRIHGTTYKIILPITVKHPSQNKKEGEIPQMKEPFAKVVYEKMLPLKAESGENIILPELAPYGFSKYILKDYITNQNKIFVLSLKRIENSNLLIKIDRSIVYRNIYRLLSTQAISVIVINEAPQDLIDGLFKMYTIFSKDGTEFFPKGKMMLLFTESIKTRKYKEGVVIAGKTESECKKINQYISDKKSYFKVLRGNYLGEDILTENEQNKINEYLEKQILFSPWQLINLDFLIDENSYFENHVKPKLERSIDVKSSIGYNWEHTHLKIGSKLHLDNFVYGKKIFQRNGEASDFAFSIARDIFEKVKGDAKDGSEQIVYTLVGYGYYSELLVSRTCDFVNNLFESLKIKKEKAYCEYIIIKDEDKIKFSRYIHNLEARKNNDTIEKLIIIVPISSTLTTCLKIENAFYRIIGEKRTEEKKRNEEEKDKKDKSTIYDEIREFKVHSTFYTPLVVGDKVDLTDLQENIGNYEAVNSVWKKVIVKEEIIITENRETKAKAIEQGKTEAEAEKEAKRDNIYNIYIESKWQLPDDCEHCFPTDPIKERPLFVTDKVAVTPSLIFDYPKCYRLNDEREPYFFLKKEVDNDSNMPNTILPIIDKIDWVHYTSDNNKHFNYYLYYLDFFEKNQYPDPEKDRLKKWTNGIRDEFSTEREGNVLLIAPDKSENGAFIHLINKEIFDDRAEIIRFDDNSDHYLNFGKFFKDKISWAKTIYFVDNLMLSGKTFLYIDEILKVSQKAKRKTQIKRIKGMFCLINRMDYSCYKTVIDKLKENNRNKKNTQKQKEDNNQKKINKFYPFVNLYVPESTLMPCPLCDEKKKYKDLRNNVSLDCIKQYFVEKEIPYFKKVKKENLMEYKLPYTPLNKYHNSTLLKVTLIHFLNKAFAERDEEDYNNKKYNKHNEKTIFVEQLKTTELPKNDSDYEKYLNFNGFCKDFRDYIENQKPEQSTIKDRDIINEFKFKANLLKVLSSQTLKKYRSIYISVFYWVLGELIAATKAILGEEFDNNMYQIFLNPKIQEELSNFSILAESNLNFSIDENVDKYIDTVNYLRLLVKVASSLNIAYLLHKDFLNAINTHINRTRKIVKKIITASKELSEEKHEKLKNKYDEMRYSFQNFKLYCAAHIIRSLYKNEQRAIRFEKNLNELNKQCEEREDRTFLELLILENTGIIRQTLDNVKNISELNQNNMYLRDFNAFCDDEKKETNFEKINIAHQLQDKLVHYEEDENYQENEEKNIVESIAKIIGYNVETGGGILLYKYRNSDGNNRDPENYIVVGECEKEKKLLSCFESQQSNCFATNFLEGINYLTESQSGKKIEYEWTSCSVFKKENMWFGQNGQPTVRINKKDCNYSEFEDIKSIDEIANRILFIRISSYHSNKNTKDNESDEELKGEAVFVFYDGDGETKGHDSLHNTRFVHVLRNEISEYLKKKYDNDAFKAWVEERKFLNAPDHNYYNILSELKECRNDDNKYDFLSSLLMVKKDISEILKTRTIKPNTNNIFEFELKNRISWYCSMMFTDKSPIIIDNTNNCKVKFHESLFRHIMYEYLRNARKGAKPENIYINISNGNNDEYLISIQDKHEYEEEDKKLLNQIQKLQQYGYFDSSKIKGLYLNYLLLEVIGCIPHGNIEIENDTTTFTMNFTLKNL